MDLDHERCYRAVASRDARFDGAFYTAVRTTGIYCRPSCPAVTPKRRNVTFYRTPAAAQGEGFRACRRCRPDAAPGSAEWNARGDVVARLMRLVADGAVERQGVAGVASTLGYSERHLNRLVTEELGAGILAIARTQRAHSARILLETTDLPLGEVAWAAGFGSIRSFNDTIATVYGESPTALRGRRRASPRTNITQGGSGSAEAWTGPGARAGRAGGNGSKGETGTPGETGTRGEIGIVVHAPIVVRLPTRAPFDAAAVLAFLGTRAVPGIEAWDGASYRRALDLPNGHATVTCSAGGPGGAGGEGGLVAEFRLADLRDLAPAVARVRRLFDLDADPQAVADVLGADPLLAVRIAARPGLRMPGSVDPHEMVVRAIVGQQVSVAGALTLVGRLVSAHGRPLALADPQLTRVFPTAEALAGLDPAALAMPRARATALVGVCRALADGSLVVDAGADRAETITALQCFAGIGPWTAAYVAMRGLGDPDVMLAGDLGVRRAIAALGGDDRPRAIEQRAHAWRPWRSYAVGHLWASLADPPLKNPAQINPPQNDPRTTRQSTGAAS